MKYIFYAMCYGFCYSIYLLYHIIYFIWHFKIANYSLKLFIKAGKKIIDELKESSSDDTSYLDMYP